MKDVVSISRRTVGRDPCVDRVGDDSAFASDSRPCALSARKTTPPPHMTPVGRLYRSLGHLALILTGTPCILSGQQLIEHTNGAPERESKSEFPASYGLA